MRGVHRWCELRDVHVRPEERVHSHRVAPGRPERLGRNPVRIANVDAAVKTATSRFPAEERDDEGLWGCSTGGVSFSVSVRVPKSASNYTTLCVAGGEPV